MSPFTTGGTSVLCSLFMSQVRPPPLDVLSSPRRQRGQDTKNKGDQEGASRASPVLPVEALEVREPGSELLGRGPLSGERSLQRKRETQDLLNV